MFKKWKKVIAAVLSSAMILTCAGCTMGKDTAYALTVDGYQVKAGVYIYYSSVLALNEAKNEAKKQDENLNTDDNAALEKVTIDGQKFLDYVKSKATEYCVNHVAVIKHFNELELSLSDDELEYISDAVDAEWDSNKNMYESNGVGKDSLKEIMESSIKNREIFNAYYGEGGIENVTDDDLKTYYVENNARVRYIDMDLHDSEGNDLDDAGKKEIKNMADDFLKRAKSAGSEEKMLEEFNAFQEEYDKYVSDKAAEASDDSGETETATTTTTTTATTTVTTTTTISAEEDDNDTDNNDSDSAETTTAAPENEETTETTTTTAPESDESDETTTTTSIHENESIIHVVTTDENTKEEDVYYNPSKKAYEWIFDDSTKLKAPEIIEDDDTMYVIVKFDINDRVTEDDLWNESNISSVRNEMFSDKMQDIIKGWGEEYEVVKNEKAYERYNPFDMKFE